MLDYFANVGAGVFLCNSIPHLVAGMQGKPFPSAFASPPGIGNSHPVLNVLWAMLNIVAGFALLGYAPVNIGLNLPFVLFLLGFYVSGSLVALYFSKVRKEI